MANRFPLIFNSGAGQIQELAVSDNLDLTSSNLVNAGILFTSSGSATAPSLQIGSGTTYNPGLYSPGTDQLAISTSGTGRITVDASGNVNIDSNTLYVDAANNRVGIGTSSPQALCHVSGGNILLSNAYYLASRNAADNASLSLIGRDTSNNVLIDPDGYGIKVGGTTLVTTSAGRVGIGTTSPQQLLQVGGFSGGNIITIAGGTSGSGSIFFADGTSGSEAYRGYIEYGHAADALQFATGASERMRIDSSGRLLVGTTSAFVDGFNNAFTSSQLSKGSGNTLRCVSDTRSVAAVNNSTVDAWAGRTAAGNPSSTNGLIGHFYVLVGGANAFSGVYSIVTTANGTSPATLTAVSTVPRGTSPVSSVQIANDGAGGAIKLTITYINNAGVVDGLTSYVSFVGLAGG